MKSPSLKDKRTEYPFSEKNWLAPPAFDQTPPSGVGTRPVAAVWAAAKDPSRPVPGALPPCFGAYLRSRALSPRWPRSADSQLLTNVCIRSRSPLRMRHCRAPHGTEPRRDFSRARGCAKLCPLSSTFSRSLADFVRKRSLNESPILGGGSEPGEHNPTRFGTETGPRKHPRDRTCSWISCQAGGVEGPTPGGRGGPCVPQQRDGRGCHWRRMGH